MIRKLIPSTIKKRIRLYQRSRNDNKLEYTNQFASIVKTDKTDLKIEVCTLDQPIFFNPLSANKVENIRIAVNLIEKVIIHPGQIFSFWKLIGEPTEKSGYKTGRNIIGDRLQDDIGGGLCQVSGILYHLALLSGLEIIERHCHTLDLYEEDKRYTPLGADATVVYGYKDIRFRNNTAHPIKFIFDVTETKFTASLISDTKWDISEIEFIREDFKGYRTIKTVRINNSQRELINTSKIPSSK